MSVNTVSLLLILVSASCQVRAQIPHAHAHAHNDYEHTLPLFEALQNGFVSVEADVHWKNGTLWVAHNKTNRKSPTLEALYLKPLDSLLKIHGAIYTGYAGSFYLMIDFKTESEATYLALQELLDRYPMLLCKTGSCAVRIFISGNRPLNKITNEEYSGVGLDGRPNDLGKGYTTDVMPVISDNYKNWSAWNGHTTPSDLQRIKDLAQRVHAEDKKLRLWASPDNEIAWQALLQAGVDLINTDQLQELHLFLQKKGL